MIPAEDLQCLKVLAVRGGCRGPIFVSTQSIGEMLGISQQTASRRLKSLESAGLITRNLAADGQHVTVTKAGEEVLIREYQEYWQDLFGRWRKPLPPQRFRGQRHR